ncbi:MAG: PAS domain S-box protein [Bacteroidia bacterium]|nr:PAS domain S-box protein [Bacteroidia bacterium]
MIKIIFYSIALGISDAPYKVLPGWALLVIPAGGVIILILLFINYLYKRQIEKKIKELKEINRKLATSESKYRLLFETANDAILLLDNNIIVDSNTTALTVFDCTKEQLLGRDFYTLSPPQQPDNRNSAEIISEVIREVFAGKPKSFQWVHAKCSGAPFFAEVSYNSIELFDEVFTQVIIRDITGKKQTEETLILSENRYRTLVKALPDIVFIISRNGNIIDYSVDDEKKLAVHDKQIIGINLRDIGLSEQDLINVYSAINNTLNKNMLHSVEYKLDTTAGLKYWEARISPFDESKVVAVIRDITERKEVELKLIRKNEEFVTLNIDFLVQNEKLQIANEELSQSHIKLQAIHKELQESEERYKFLSGLTEEAIVIHKEGVALDFNDSLCKLTGYTREEMLGKDIIKLLAYGDSYKKVVQKVIEKYTLPYEVEGIMKDGTIIQVEIESRNTLYKGENVRVASLRNIGYRKKAEQALRESEERLRQSQKLEAIGTLASGIAHDFNNLLTPIQGYAQLLKDEIPANTQANDDLEQILIAAERAKTLVNQILTFSRKFEAGFQSFEIQPVIFETLKLIRSSIPSSIEIKQNIEAAPIFIYGDPSRFHQAIINLCTNAYQAMQKGGILEVKLIKLVPDISFFEKHPKLEAEKDYVFLSISDSGEGINTEIINRIFEPFFTTKPKDKGTGLGLSIVHGIIDSMKGDISVFTEQGIGTSFHIYLPAYEKETKASDSSGAALPAGNNEIIVLIDDEVSILNYGTRLLNKIGYKVLTFSNSAEAMAYMSDKNNQVDLLITDYTMPGLNGLQIAEKSKKIRPFLPVILISGLIRAVSSKQIKHSGIKKIITKPFTQNEIANTVAELL